MKIKTSKIYLKFLFSILLSFNILIASKLISQMPNPGYSVTYLNSTGGSDMNIVFSVLSKEDNGWWIEFITGIETDATTKNIIKAFVNILPSGEQNILRLIMQPATSPAVEYSKEMIEQLGATITMTQEMLSEMVNEIQSFKSESKFKFSTKSNVVKIISGRPLSCSYYEAINKSDNFKYYVYLNNEIYPFGIVEIKTKIDGQSALITLTSIKKTGAKSAISGPIEKM